MDERERSIIAAHEVGHAICGKVHGDKRQVEEICLFAHGEALGVTVSSQEDNDLPSESDLRARLVALMGGRAAEELLFHEVTGGASNDFEKANQIATTMVTKWGMGRDPEAADGGIVRPRLLSFLVATPERSLPSEVQAGGDPGDPRHPRRGLRGGAVATLIDNMSTLRRLAAYLVEHERVDGDDVRRALRRPHDVPNADRASGAPRRSAPAGLGRDRAVPRSPPEPAGSRRARAPPVPCPRPIASSRHVAVDAGRRACRAPAAAGAAADGAAARRRGARPPPASSADAAPVDGRPASRPAQRSALAPRREVQRSTGPRALAVRRYRRAPRPDRRTEDRHDARTTARSARARAARRGRDGPS